MKGLNINVNEMESTLFEKCDICVLSRQHILPYKKRNEYRSSRPLQLIHTDLVIVNQKGRNNERYILNFMDDFSSFKVTYCIQSKDSVLTYLKQFVNYVQAISNYKVNSIRCERGGEGRIHK